jgi:hypothetical protein
LQVIGKKMEIKRNSGRLLEISGHRTGKMRSGKKPERKENS